MYLSRLLLNPKNPAVRRDVSDCHALHRTLMRCFGQIDANHPRAHVGLLYRVEGLNDGRLQILVHSRVRPDWSCLAPHYLETSPQEYPNASYKSVSEFYARLEDGAQLRFRLRANPSRRLMNNGKRVELTREADQLSWLERHAEQAGFRLVRMQGTEALALQILPEVKAAGRRSSAGSPPGLKLTLGSVVFDGLLRVVDRDRFLHALEAGVGPGKAFGFGLLSIAPLPR